MKTVKIPTCANPFVVIVNGKKYTYPAGETVEVPDEVAEVIEQHEEAHVKPEPAPVLPPFVPAPSEGGGSGGGSGLTVVELTTDFEEGSDHVTYTETEGAAIDAAMAQDLPFVIRFSLFGSQMTCIANIGYDNGQYCFVDVAGEYIAFAKHPELNAWTAEFF